MYERLFSPFRLGRRESRNRIVSTSHGTNLAENGWPSDRLIAYHEAKAKGGCGVVMMFGSAAASRLTPIPPNHVNLWDDGCVPGLRAAASAVRQHGALAISQITSMGRRTSLHQDIVGSGPSDTGGEISPEIPHVLSVAEIGRIVGDYARAAARLEACGFDGCDLAFYDDQLPDQMWNPAINKRTDAYGGSLEHRMRFSIEVVRAVREAVSREFVVGARVSADDRMTPGLARRELLEIIARLDALDLLDYFTITGGTIEGYASRAYNIPSAYYPKRTFEPLAALVRKRVRAPLILTGRITTPDEAEAVLESGVADFVGMTRALIADPELPRKASAGRSDEIRFCMGSNEGCIDRLYFGFPIACVQNAVVGREREWSTLEPAAKPQRVAIVGGGPAGMEAARVAAERGHDVTLYERSDELGGAIRVASRAPGWENYASIVDWLERELTRCGVRILRGHDVDVASLDALDAQAIVFATGARPRRPYLPGAERANAAPVADVLAGRFVPPGKRVVILDETGYTPGAKTADYLADRGYDVEIVTRQYSLGETIGITVRATLTSRLMRKGVAITALHAPVRVTESGVVLRNVLTDEEREVAADAILFASSGVGDDALHTAYVSRFGGAHVHLIGDAFAPRHLRHAVADGARIGRAL